MARQAGFAYLTLLYAVALLSVSMLAVGTLGYFARIRAEENQLLQMGGEFRRALIRYRDAAEPRMYPTSLDELLLDRRSGVARRHLRKIYVDPITRTREWGLVTEGGRIVGVRSNSDRKPLKETGFDTENAGFENAAHYSDWVFGPALVADPQDPKGQGAGAPPARTAPSGSDLQRAAGG
nr:type II secretion system protein [Dyella sp. ASV24]